MNGHKLYINLIILLCLESGATYAQSNTAWKEPENLTVLNTKEDDFGPAWNRFDSLLYFNSTINGYSGFFVTDKVFSAMPEPVPGAINKKNDNRSYICFESEDKAYLTVFRQYLSRSWQNIYETQRKKNEWTTPFPVDSLMSESFNAHPTIAPDGSIMVFSSNRNSPNGDADLWIAYKTENGGWGGARPLPDLSSTGNEITPFLASADTLYFASDGHGGPGGFDIFISVNVMGLWQNPYPLNSINSRHNESDFIVLPDGRAVFSSDRPGGKGKLDLYWTKREEQKTIISKNESELELSIATQVSTIRTFLDLKYSYFPLVTSMFNMPESGFSLFENSPVNIEQQIPISLDSVYRYSLAVIGIRMHQYPEATLKIILLNRDNDKDENVKAGRLADSISKFLQQYYSVTGDRITIANSPANNDYTDSSVYPILMLSSGHPELLSPLMLGETTVRIDPPVLQASIYARPENLLKNYICDLYYNKHKTAYTNSGNNLNEPFFIDLTKYRFGILKADSLVLQVTAWDKDENKTSGNLNINVSYSEGISRQFTKLKSGVFEEMYILMAGQAEYFESAAFRNVIEKITESCAKSKSVKLQYFDNGNYISKELAQLLIRAMEERSTGICRFTTEFCGNDSFVGSSPLKPYVLKLIFEIR